MTDESGKENRIRKLIALMKRMGRSSLKPDLKNTDYSGWNQTEEEYLQGQKEWLERIAQRKKTEKKDRK